MSASVAALVTKEAVADIFPTGLAEGVCGMCNKQSTGLSLQLVSCCEERAAVIRSRRSVHPASWRSAWLI